MLVLVAPRKGSVDWNIEQIAPRLFGLVSLPARGVWIEIQPTPQGGTIAGVTPRKGSVD